MQFDLPTGNTPAELTSQKPAIGDDSNAGVSAGTKSGPFQKSSRPSPAHPSQRKTRGFRSIRNVSVAAAVLYTEDSSVVSEESPSVRNALLCYGSGSCQIRYQGNTDCCEAFTS